jgi:hypothetical protein
LSSTRWNANCSSSSAREAPFANNDITRHASRLDRDLGHKPFADAGYAMQELVAEIDAALAREQRLEQALCLRMLSSIVPVQSVRRFGKMRFSDPAMFTAPTDGTV